MNLTIGRTLPNIGRRINWQAVTLGGGLALAISLAVGIGAFSLGSKPAPTGATQPVSVSAPTAGILPVESITRPVVVIVSTQEQADRLRSVMAGDEMAAAGEGDRSLHKTSFVVIDSPDKQYLYDAVIADQKGSGAFNIVDLRN